MPQQNGFGVGGGGFIWPCVSVGAPCGVRTCLSVSSYGSQRSKCKHFSILYDGSKMRNLEENILIICQTCCEIICVTNQHPKLQLDVHFTSTFVPVCQKASYFLSTVGSCWHKSILYCLHESSLRFPHLYLKSCNWTVVCFKNKFLKWHQLLWASPGTEVSRRAHKKATETESGGGESAVCAKAASCWVSPPSSPSAAQTEPFHHTRAPARQD